jgi:tight adherence protein C
MLTIIFIAGSLATGALALLVARNALVASRARRLLTVPAPAAAPREGERLTAGGRLALWLLRAGYREPSAPATFIGTAAVAAVLGIVTPIVLLALDVSAPIVEGVRALPGDIGEGFAPIARMGPFTTGLCVAAAPWLVVRRRRRRLLESVERDLPLTLDLLATLADAGLGFDAALARVLQSSDPDRPLARDLRQFQLEVRTGRPRAECFRRLRDRLDAPSVNVLVGALVTSEQLGASVADVLRVQADDLRARRRERALALAQTVPVKLVFPLMICFLPSIFAITLGPAFYQLLQLADTVGRGAR